jgi:hypothetical protein
MSLLCSRKKVFLMSSKDDSNQISGAIEYNTADMTATNATLSVSLDSLGPVVVNEDGTISRITNWHEMTDIEKNNILRILPKRNEKRLEKLKSISDA